MKNDRDESPEVTRQVVVKPPGAPPTELPHPHSRAASHDKRGRIVILNKDNNGRGARGDSRSDRSRSRSRSRSRTRSRSRSRSGSPYHRHSHHSHSHSRYRSPRSRSRSPRSPYRGDYQSSFPPREQHFCHDCKVPFNDDNAYEHFSSRNHRERTRYKIRCYLCSRYVQNPKDHLEHSHVRDVFQCRGHNCSQPKFLELIKILNHIWDKHPTEMGSDGSADDLIRRGMITIPCNLSSYKCRLCNRNFVGQSLSAVLKHQRWEDNVKEPRERDVIFFCRICGTKRAFNDDVELQEHIRGHGYHTKSSRSRSRSR